VETWVIVAPFSLHGKRQVFYSGGVMSEVQSTFRLQPGDVAPEFQLPEPGGEIHSLSGLKGQQGLLVFFACNHCPYVIHLAEAVGKLAEEVASKGVNTVAIMSNDITNYPEDHPKLMGSFAADSGWSFPYLYDENQEVAKAWSAACTPDFFLLDARGLLFYAGQFDGSRPKKGGEVNGIDMRNAIDSLIAGEDPPQNPFPSSGCNIKWKDGNEPAYFG
jgi:peroxiredoxin